MINRRGIIVNGLDHLSPKYRISPFKEEYIHPNRNRNNLPSSGKIFSFFNTLFPNKSVQLTSEGRSAIGLAMKILKLKRDDCVTIITTTNNYYISGCVTREIEKTCNWSRELNKNTRAIFVNHEFGLFNRDLEKYKELGIPIIEDFAHSFCSFVERSTSGMQGDYLVCSFSKIFPMQAGGVLLFNDEKTFSDEGDRELLNYVDTNASYYINTLEEIKEKRLVNYDIFCEKFRSIGIEPFFKFSKNDVPGVFCFKLREDIDTAKFKESMNSDGIESSVFYGENAYFVPCHQNLNDEDINYIFEVSKYYLGK